MKPDLQKRPYQKKYKFNNPGHINGYTDAPAYYSGKIFCQKCTVWRRYHKALPTQEQIKKLKQLGRWKH